MLKRAFLAGCLMLAPTPIMAPAMAADFYENRTVTLINSEAAGTNPDLILTAGGCGRGWHRGPYGHCVRNMGPGPAYPCWWVRGPYGHWHMVCR